MTETNPIFQEIEEDINRQRMEAFWKKYGPWVITFAAVIILGTAGGTGWRSWRAQQQEKASEALATIIDNPSADSPKQIEMLENYAAKNRGEAQAVFAQLHAASLAAKTGDSKKAVAIYDGVASDTKADPAFRQLADFYSVQAQMDTGDADALQKRLQPLLANNSPWRYSAMEYNGFLAFRAGDKAKAKQIFTELAQDTNAPTSLATRAGDMVRFIGE